MALEYVEKRLSSALAAYIKSVSEKPTCTVVVGNSVEENYRQYEQWLAAQPVQEVEKTALERYLEYGGNSGSITAPNNAQAQSAANATQAARVELQMGLQALLFPPPVVVVQRKNYVLEPTCSPKEERVQLSIMVDIASLIKRLCLYVAQRDELLAGKNDKSATTRRLLIDLISDRADVVFDSKIKDADDQYELAFSADDLFNRVYTYTAQKARFIAAAMKDKDSSLGVERGVDLWAMSPDERAKGVFDQLLSEALSEVGTLLYPISKQGNKVVDGASIFIDKKSWVTGALLRTIYGKVENLLVAYVLLKWYTVASVAEEVKIQQSYYDSGLPFMQLLCAQDYTEDMLRDFLRQGAADMWRRISGYCAEEQPLLFDESNPNPDNAATDTEGKVVVLLSLPSSRITKLQQPLAEAFSAGLYRYALAAWFGMQEDRNEQGVHLAEYDNNRSSMVVLLGKRG